MTTVVSKAQERIVPDGPTVFKTPPHQVEVRCGMCGSLIYVDEETFRFVEDAIKAGLDDPFRCARCKLDYDELAYEG